MLCIDTQRFLRSYHLRLSNVIATSHLIYKQHKLTCAVSIKYTQGLDVIQKKREK